MSERFEDVYGDSPCTVDAMPSVGEAVVELLVWGVWLWPVVFAVAYAMATR